MRVEVVQRACSEEDRVSERSEPGRERRRTAVRPRDRDLQKRRLDGAQHGWVVKCEPIAIDNDSRPKRRQRFRHCLAGNRDRPKELEVPERSAEVRVGVDDHAVTAGAREGHGLGDPSVRPDRRMPVDDRLEIALDDDQVNPCVRAGAPLVVRQRRAGRLLDRERQALRLVRNERLRGEAGEPVGPRSADLDLVRPRRPATGEQRGGEQQQSERFRQWISSTKSKLATSVLCTSARCTSRRLSKYGSRSL